MLYIANIKLSESFYQSFTTKSKQAHIIEAETLDEAKDKLYNFYLNTAQDENHIKLLKEI
jgi:hypothetical protein